MIFHQIFQHVFIALSLLCSSASTAQPAPWFSLWGSTTDFTSGCSHWSLNSQVSLPDLQEFTVCFSLKFNKDPSSLYWTAFMYRHPDVQHAELGFGGKLGHLVVWLCGAEWMTVGLPVKVAQWHSLCLTWSHTKDRPTLYIDGNLVEISAAHSSGAACSKLAAAGTLTLGASHKLVDGKIKVLPETGLPGDIAQFRLWSQKMEEISARCDEGDVLKWQRDNWDSQLCASLPDPSLQCEWSFFKVILMFAIMRYEGNKTELYDARDIAHNWLREVLPPRIYLPSVSVFEVTSKSATRFDKDLASSQREWQLRWAPETDRFDCLVYLNVIPPMDVAAVQTEIYRDLQIPYHDSQNRQQLLANPDSIYTIPVESLSFTTVSPTNMMTLPSTVSTTLSTTSAGTSTSFPTTVAPTISFTARPSSVSELYFEVRVNVSITGDYDPELVLSMWLNTTLPNDMMKVLDLQMLPADHSHPLNHQSKVPIPDEEHKVSRESCVFQVQVLMSLSETQEMEELIRVLLLTPYDSGSISIATDDIQISRILIFNCDAQSHQTLKGRFVWPITSGGNNAIQPCPKNPSQHATRHCVSELLYGSSYLFKAPFPTLVCGNCKLSLKTHWMDPDLENCALMVETISDLEDVEVTFENALNITEMIESLLHNQSSLNYKELATILNKLEDILNISVVTPCLGQALINIISDILESDSNLVPFTNIILNLTEAVADRMVGYNGSTTLVAPAVAISVIDVVPGLPSSLTFGVSSYYEGAVPEIFINRYPFNGTVAFISLPSILQQSLLQSSYNNSPPRVTFQFFGIPLLFENNQQGVTLNTFVVSASVTNASSPIKDLTEDVKVTLQHIRPNTLHKDVQCVYWNFNLNNGHGGWDNYGCMKFNTTSDYTTCLSDHLTHFGVLLDVSRTPVDPAHEQILTIITYVGCGVSSLFLGVTVLTYTAFEKLRRDYPSKILINLSLALLGLNLVFLVNSWLSSWGLYGLCVAAASTLHYFLLASFTWMGLEAVNMYFALVKVFNVYVPSYILKFCALGWGVPLAVCVLVLIVNREAYGSHLYTDAPSSLQPLDNSDTFCWLQDDVTFYVSVVAYALMIFLFNIAIFVVVLIQIRHMRANSPAGTHSGLMQDLRGVSSLTLLLGLTWTVGFFTWGPARTAQLYLFAGLNSLQGFFIFLFHCLMKENVRRQWRIHLCFGRFRLEEHSEWSNSASVGVTAKPRSNSPRVPSVRSVKSSSTDSTSASSESSQRDLSSKRPNLGLFVNSLVLPRAQANPSGSRAVPQRQETNLTPGWRNHLLD